MASRAIKGRYNVKKKSGKAFVLAILSVIIATIGAICVGGVALASVWLEDLPDYSDANALNTSATSVVYASDGTTVLAEFQLENREPVEYNQISDYVLQGTVACEDERFYNHSGVDFIGSMRALVVNVLGGSLEGGSTITQQLVRNTMLSDEMQEISFKRKIREMFLAMKVEEMYSKEEILLMYLNTINYGSGAYGIEAASERYFSKHASELTLAEAATLIGIPQSPNYNEPIDYPDNAKNRRNLVLDRMVTNGYISTAEADSVRNEDIVLNTTAPSINGIVAYPYFASYVRNQLLNENGKYAFSTAELFKGGLDIVTTLDISDQQAAEEACRNKAKQAGAIFEVAMAAIDNTNGHIVAMVGGDNYDETQVNMATGEGTAGRQCGSSFKTFTLAAAIEAGIDPETVIDAGYSVDLEGTDRQVYNAGKASYGSISIKKATALSSNTAFTRLIMSVGVDKVRDMAQRLGIKSPLQNVAGITLGIDSVNPLEMASAYSTIASGGIYYEPECILTIKDRAGNVIVDNSHPEGERVLSPEVSRAVIDCLEGVITSGTGKPAALTTGQVCAGKTGTTETDQDSYFVGFTPQLTAAFWLGERADSYDQAHAVSVSVSSAFSEFMSKVLSDEAPVDFFTAGKPSYTNYSDEKNHIGKGYWKASESSSSSSSSDAEVSSASSKGHSSSKKNHSSSSSGSTSGSQEATTPDPEPVTPPVDNPDPGGEDA